MASTRWSRRIESALTERLGYKAAALFFAIALWVAASGDETAAQSVPVEFLPVVDSTVRVTGAMPTVHALVAGPTRELLELYAKPPAIRRIVGATVADSVSIELRAADVDLPTSVKSVSVRDVEPRVVTLHLERARP